MHDTDLASRPVSLTDGDREPVHLPSSVQPHGALVAFDAASLAIRRAGGDTVGLLGARATDLIGQPIACILSPAQIETLGRSIRPMVDSAPATHAFETAGSGGPVCHANAYGSGELTVVEFERLEAASLQGDFCLLQTMMREIQRQPGIASFLDAIALQVRTATNFDRVVVYRFDHDGSGIVVAESCADHAGSFLGLSVPASGIPRQARTFHTANVIRAIPDTGCQPAMILPVTPSGPDPLDLSQSRIRSISPAHLHDLGNLGVRASLSMSLLLDNELWGLVVGHHPRPHAVPKRTRNVLEMLSDLLSAQLELRLKTQEMQDQLTLKDMHERFIMRVNQEPDLVTGLTKHRPNLFDVVPASGVALWLDGTFQNAGTTPDRDQVASLVEWLNEKEDGVFHTASLPLVYRPAEAFASIASGLLAVSVSKTSRDYVLWFRPELLRTVTWAGDPQDRLLQEPKPSPRHNVAAWQETVRHHAAPWTATELANARQLRVALLEIVLRRLDQLARERESSNAQQRDMMRALDRRLHETMALASELGQETERRAKAEAELSRVLGRVVEDQEAERQRIARELHDSLGQSLTLLQLGLSELESGAADGATRSGKLAKLRKMLDETGRDLNRIAWEIRPTALDDIGIETAARNLLDKWSEQTRLPYEYHSTIGDAPLSPRIKTALYRVLQEGLTNVARHSGAASVAVVFSLTAEGVILIVEDDGKGFPSNPETACARRLGLLGIRERLALVGGAMEIESAPNVGTTLFVHVPL